MDVVPYFIIHSLFFLLLFGPVVYIAFTKHPVSHDSKNVFYSKLYAERIRSLIIRCRNGNKTDVIRTKIKKRKPLCSKMPNLKTSYSGFGLNVTKGDTRNLTMTDIEKKNIGISPGGGWRPEDCVALHRVAIIVPYRKRYTHLMRFLAALIPMLKRQRIHFKIYIAEQVDDLKFNRGKLFNAGYIEALKEEDWQCFIFHDVDLLPEDTRNMYTCSEHPRHMSVEIDTMNYRLFYEELVGGVLNIRTEHFRHVNGFSNDYWGWGGEDDDMFKRLNRSGYRIDRQPYHLAKYTMISHKHNEDDENPVRNIMLKKSELRMNQNGLNTIKYELISKTRMPLYTRLKFYLGPPPNSILYTARACKRTLDLYCLFKTLMY